MTTKLSIYVDSPETATAIIGIMERLREAEAKHPDWPVGDLFQQVCIMQEESGEVIKAALDFHNGTGTIADMKTELMQTAAMCLRILKNM